MPPSRKQLYELMADTFVFLLCLVCIACVPVSLTDDAFIAYRYAANLAHGAGLVFNPGQRVEGVSDVSWTVLMAIPEFLHIRPELFAIGLASLSAAAALLVVRRTLVLPLGVSRLTALVIVCLAAFNCDYWIMVGNGIESGLYALVLVCSFSLLLRNRLAWAGFMLGFATTLRPESLALAPLTVFCAGAFSYGRQQDLRNSFRAMLQLRRLLIVWAIVVLTVLAWRYSYYGAWVPNTVVAKSHPVQISDFKAGSYYVVRFVGRSLPWLPVALCVLFLNAPVPLLTGLAWLAFQFIVVLPNAGDWMPGYRLLSVYMPVLVLLSAFAIDRMFKSQVARRSSFTAIFVICCVVQVRDRRWTTSEGILDRHKRTEMVGVDENSFLLIAAAIRPALKDGDIVAPEVLGSFSYLLQDVPMHDWLGLVDAHVAHNGTVFLPMYGKADPSYSVETIAPALFVLIRGDNTLKIFQRHTKGRFAEKYNCWVVLNRPERIMLAIRRDREQDILSVMNRSTLMLRPIPADPLTSGDSDRSNLK
jgi:hypothetical protein